MKSILLYVGQGSTLEGSFEVALDLARTFGAHITCLQAIPIEALITSGPFVGVYPSDELLLAVREGEDQRQALIETRLKSEGVSWSWIRSDEPAARSIISNSRLADIVVLGLPSPQAPEMGISRSLVAHVAIHARSPVLAVPPEVRGLDCRGAAVIAWNGSMESSHAMRFAVPLLREAGKVQLVEVTEGETAFPATEGAEYLARHGIGSDVCEWQRNGSSVAEALLDAAAKLGGAYLVAGAYGHTRFREAVLGGVTRELIQHSPLPLLLGH